MLFNPYTGIFDIFESLEDAVSAKNALIEEKIEIVRKSTILQAEGTNKNGDSVIVGVSDNGELNAFVPPVPSNQELESTYGRPLTEEEIAAWEEYRELLRNIEDQPDYPWDFIMPSPPEIAPR